MQDGNGDLQAQCGTMGRAAEQRHMASVGCRLGAKSVQKESSSKKPPSDNGASGDSAGNVSSGFFRDRKKTGCRLASLQQTCWTVFSFGSVFGRCLKRRRSWRMMFFLQGSFVGGRKWVDRFITLRLGKSE